MSRLHLVARSPFQSSALESCLDHLGEGDALLLLGDGVLAAPAGTVISERLAAAMTVGLAVFVLAPDLHHRGLAARPLQDGIRAIDHGGFVDLVAAHRACQAWA